MRSKGGRSTSGWTGTGTLVGVPLFLLQYATLQATPSQAPPDLGLLGIDLLLGHAVYDADRIVAPPLSAARATTRVAAIMATVALARDAPTLAPLVPALHLGYTDVLKPRLDFAKPFVVAGAWTLAVYDLPLLRAGVADAWEPTVAATVFLGLACGSHLADLRDVEEDAAAGVRTPAVRLGDAQARAYAVALAVAFGIVHARSPIASGVVDDALLAATLVEAASAGTVVRVAAALVVLKRHEVELLRTLILGSELPHRAGVDAFVRVMAVGADLPAPWRDLFLDAAMASFDAADGVGKALMHLYHQSMR